MDRFIRKRVKPVTRFYKVFNYMTIDLDEIIEMALCDHTSFAQIKDSMVLAKMR